MRNQALASRNEAMLEASVQEARLTFGHTLG